MQSDFPSSDGLPYLIARPPYRPATLSPGHAPLHFLGEDFLTKPEKDCIRDSGAEEMFSEPVFIEVDA